MTEQLAKLNYKQLFDDAPCGYLLVAPNGEIIHANNWISTLLGYQSGGIDGKRLRDILSIAARILYETNLAPLLRLQQAVSEVTIDLKRRDGKAIPVIMSASQTYDAAGLPDTTRIAFVLAAERRLYERELVSQRDSAEEGFRQEQADGVLREQFVAILSHDLRNPVASITAATRMLAKEALSDRGKQVLGLMQGSALRMSSLIENILDFARARLGSGIGLSLHTEQSLQPLIDQVVLELRAVHPDHGILTSYEFLQPLTCDPLKIGQLVSNLLGNALTHGDETKPIRLDCQTRDGQLRLSVTNGGKPIPDAVIPTLFDPFVRGQPNSYTNGLGLGLFIAKQIATAHGGALDVSSGKDETRFTFTMPLGGPGGSVGER
ncbi:PAS domain-containing sensor histidine kinase [Rhizobium wenxiniae]|uniref:histidine kinase n=1 Tax=Rhizobium wenxiniae TaxID=1737357 RepID=A0A7W9YAW4_9HYPH|nr:PAS domain-containing sensor histidine kinase [Rhizobium wenxiniae]MBB6165224.1 sigma-B regulation protein RsbU (phosphoserine phosphatase) [Rhizobium wenxiniae]GGG13756.1 PAS domain-containing sensor histidine kinase [Rhizobium wenxiniae]